MRRLKPIDWAMGAAYTAATIVIVMDSLGWPWI